ncbi:2OG-Fe(II) oxygenase family protein [Neptunomonas antarctica]|uniref:2OG-Fe(II) oxygenase superfamily protein n=1 Tax=Neptunomonas antarctica TaxID=619304 RepID=A0A1N7MX80_9GAMM|nr:2OG-Fe(II) oxygenase [Neptunomonas antarctica]SIS90489.1 2OG-Fe(II) oxygenase superfamily protein [Neptunomonas antarctica]
MLLQPKHHDKPFSFFSVASAFSEEQCAALECLFVQAGEWQHHDGDFYRCALKDVTENIPATFQTEVLVRMREITGLPLVNRVLVTTQRMLPGHVIGLHSDRPLLGYEFVRLVVQLNKEWQPDHGGVLELFSSPESAASFRLDPEYNAAFGFALHAESYHGVTEVSQPRQTVVFNFWHVANTVELAAHLQTLFANLHFSELPAALNPIASDAELNLPEDITFRAGTAAIALHRWGYDEAIIVAGYQHSAGLLLCNRSDTETYAAVLLADWIAFLYLDSFDLARWKILCSELDGIEVFAQLMQTWELCLPELSV